MLKLYTFLHPLLYIYPKQLFHNILIIKVTIRWRYSLLLRMHTSTSTKSLHSCVEFFFNICNFQLELYNPKNVSQGTYNEPGYVHILITTSSDISFNPYPMAFPYRNGMVLHFYQQQESSTTKTVHKVINKGLKTYV